MLLLHPHRIHEHKCLAPMAVLSRQSVTWNQWRGDNSRLYSPLCRPANCRSQGMQALSLEQGRVRKGPRSGIGSPQLGPKGPRRSVLSPNAVGDESTGKADLERTGFPENRTTAPRKGDESPIALASFGPSVW